MDGSNTDKRSKKGKKRRDGREWDVTLIILVLTGSTYDGLRSPFPHPVPPSPFQPLLPTMKELEWTCVVGIMA